MLQKSGPDPLVRITETALSNVAEIIDYIARDSPETAVGFGERLIAACEDLAEQPERYPLVPRFEKSGIRRRPFGAYLIFYRVISGKVEVSYVLHGARDYEALLFPEA